MYISFVLLIIVSLNIRRMLRIIKREMDIVYHKSLWMEPQPGGEGLMLSEFRETNSRIDEMQRQIEEMIEKEKRQKEELLFKVSAASHDLRTPLTVIQGNTDLLLYSDLKEEDRVCLEVKMVLRVVFQD